MQHGRRRYGFVVMDGNGSLFGTVSGNTREVLGKFSVELPKKHGRGGQSALRFARLRMEKRHNYVRKVSLGLGCRRHSCRKACLLPQTGPRTQCSAWHWGLLSHALHACLTRQSTVLTRTAHQDCTEDGGGRTGMAP